MIDRRALQATWVLAALLAASLVWVGTASYGPGLTPDSAQYMAASRSLAAGSGFSKIDGAPMVEWPPLYPILLRLAGDPLVGGRAWNALAALVIVLAAAVLLFQATGSRGWAALGASAIALWFPVFRVASSLWSDAWFAALFLVSALALDRARGRGVRPVLVAAIPVALACIARYLGVALALGGAIALLLEPRRGRLRPTILFLGASLAPVAVWIGRNLALTQTATGLREPTGATLAGNVGKLAGLLIDGLLPWSIPTVWKLAALAALTILALGIRRKGARVSGDASILGILTLAYAVALVSVSAFWGSDAIDMRLTLPLLLATLLLWMRLLYRRLGWMPAVLALVSLLWIGRSATVTLRHVALYRQEGVPGYLDRASRGSELLAALRTRRLSGAVYSNEPERLYVSLGAHARLAPRRHLYFSNLPTEDLARLESALEREGPGTLVWFDTSGRTQLYSPGALQERFPLTETLRARDGTIYLMASAEPRK